jgi:hypothetical protein
VDVFPVHINTEFVRYDAKAPCGSNCLLQVFLRHGKMSRILGPVPCPAFFLDGLKIFYQRSNVELSTLREVLLEKAAPLSKLLDSTALAMFGPEGRLNGRLEGSAGRGALISSLGRRA